MWFQVSSVVRFLTVPTAQSYDVRALGSTRMQFFFQLFSIKVILAMKDTKAAISQGMILQSVPANRRSLKERFDYEKGFGVKQLRK